MVERTVLNISNFNYLFLHIKSDHAYAHRSGNGTIGRFPSTLTDRIVSKNTFTAHCRRRFPRSIPILFLLYDFNNEPFQATIIISWKNPRSIPARPSYRFSIVSRWHFNTVGHRHGEISVNEKGACVGSPRTSVFLFSADIQHKLEARTTTISISLY